MFRIVLTFTAFVLLLSCRNQSNDIQDSAHEKDVISLTILPQKYFLEKITGDKYEINVMIPPGFAHASYDPTPRQMNALADSKLYLRIGKVVFEQVWMKSISENNPDLKIFDLSEGIKFEESEHSHEHEHSHKHAELYESVDTNVDPHIWMSVNYAEIIARNTLNALLETFPSDSSYFLSNYKELQDEISEVRIAWDSEKDNLKDLAFIIYHPALGYLAHEYGMEQVVLETDGKEPAVSHLREVVDIAREKNIKHVFIQKQFNVDNAKTLAKETGTKIVQIDPLDENWNSQMYHILNVLLEK